MEILGKCEVCNRDITRDDTYEGCSEFCAEATDDDKGRFKILKEGEWGRYPCTECGCTLEDIYKIGDYCSRCGQKIRYRAAETRAAAAETRVKELEIESALWKKEAQAAYDYNKNINKWWAVKVERIQLEASHRPAVDVKSKQYAKLWKRLAKVYTHRVEVLKELYEHEISQLQTSQQQDELNQVNDACIELRGQVAHLTGLINNPVTDDFLKAVQIEVAHQQELWRDTDAVKSDVDWFWLIGYLAGKAMWNPMAGDDFKEKRKHRVITIAAAACSWWRSLP